MIFPSLLPYAGNSRSRTVRQHRRLKAASRCLTDLIWPDPTYSTTLAEIVEDNAEECHQWTSESGVRSWLNGTAIRTESNANDSQPPPHLPSSYLPFLLFGDNDVLVYRFPFHKRPQPSPAPPAFWPPLHPTSLYVAARRCSRRDLQASNRCGAVSSGMPGGRSVGRQHAVVIDKTVHGWCRVVTSCMRVTLPRQPAPRVVMYRTVRSPARWPAGQTVPSTGMICRARLPSSDRRRLALSQSIRTAAGLAGVYQRCTDERGGRLDLPASLLAARLCVSVAMSTSALYNQWCCATTGWGGAVTIRAQRTNDSINSRRRRRRRSIIVVAGLSNAQRSW